MTERLWKLENMGDWLSPRKPQWTLILKRKQAESTRICTPVTTVNSSSDRVSLGNFNHSSPWTKRLSLLQLPFSSTKSFLDEWGYSFENLHFLLVTYKITLNSSLKIIYFENVFFLKMLSGWLKAKAAAMRDRMKGWGPEEFKTRETGLR